MTENRRSLRRPSRMTSRALCWKGSAGPGQNLALAVLDVSETGVRLRVREQLPPGLEVSVELIPPGHDRPVRATGRVVWCEQEQGRTWWCVGIDLDRRLGHSAVQDLGRMQAF